MRGIAGPFVERHGLDDGDTFWEICHDLWHDVYAEMLSLIEDRDPAARDAAVEARRRKKAKGE